MLPGAKVLSSGVEKQKKKKKTNKRAHTHTLIHTPCKKRAHLLLYLYHVNRQFHPLRELLFFSLEPLHLPGSPTLFLLSPGPGARFFSRVIYRLDSFFSHPRPRSFTLSLCLFHPPPPFNVRAPRSHSHRQPRHTVEGNETRGRNDL